MNEPATGGRGQAAVRSSDWLTLGLTLALVALLALDPVLNSCRTRALAPNSGHSGSQRPGSKPPAGRPASPDPPLSLMAKRRAEDSVLLLQDSPSKRCCRAAVDTQLGRVAPAGGVSPPSLLALLGGRTRKRPHSSEEQPGEEAASAAAAPHRQAAHCDTKEHAADVGTLQTSGSLHDRRGSQKRPREDSTVSETVAPQDNDKADEDCSYNSFQFWRPPLPELDLSLLEDAADRSQTKSKSKVSSSSDAMET